MTWSNRVVWAEGLFLRPQHFQQSDRYFERLVRDRVSGVVPCAWGVTDLEINRELLKTGRFAISRCHGILEDGTPFRIPEDTDHPEPLDLPENTRNCIVYLALPTMQPGSADVAELTDRESLARFHPSETEVSDSVSGSDSVAILDVGKLRMRYALESDERAGLHCLGLARIVEVKADRNVVLDDRYIAPTLNCSASQVLQGFITEVEGLIRHRSEALAARVSSSGARGTAEIADFLLLQVVNRFEPEFAHYANLAELHPEQLYRTGLQLAGELATFTTRNKRPSRFPPYRHHDLQATFEPLMNDLRQSLSAVLEQTAIPIPLQLRKYGIRVGRIDDRSLLAESSFVLAVKADLPAEAVRRNFPTHAKIGPVEQIRELVNVALPGIKVRPLPVAPRQIPYHAGVNYFELDNTSQYWKALGKSGGIAIHVSGEFPGLDMELWAIRSSGG